MRTAEKVSALLEALGPIDFRALPPAERRRLADQCRRVILLADPPAPVARKPACGVLAALGDGVRAD